MKVCFKIYELETKEDAKALKKAIKEEKGIRSIGIDFKRSLAIVKFDGKILSEHRVKIAFLKAGHIVGVYQKPVVISDEELKEGFGEIEEETPEVKEKEVKEKEVKEEEEYKEEVKRKVREEIQEEAKEKAKDLLKKNIIDSIKDSIKLFKQKADEKREIRIEDKAKLAKEKTKEDKIKEKELEKQKKAFEKKIAKEKAKEEKLKKKLKEEKAKKRVSFADKFGEMVQQYDKLREQKLKFRLKRKKVRAKEKAIEEAEVKKREAKIKVQEKVPEVKPKLEKKEKAKKKLSLRDKIALYRKAYSEKIEKRRAETAKKRKVKKKKIREVKEERPAKEGIREPEEILEKVELDKRVIPVLPKQKQIEKTPPEDFEEITEEMERLRIKALFASIFFVPLLYIAVAPKLGLPITFYIERHINVFHFILATPIIAIGYRFFIKGMRSIVNKKLNIYTLVSLASGTAYVYSLVMGILMIFGTISSTKLLYFDIAGILIGFMLLNHNLEAKLHNKVIHEIKRLTRLKSNSATLVKDLEEIQISIERVKKGDIINVKEGEKIPLDGVIIDGYCNTDESSITGNLFPVKKDEGDFVIAGTKVIDGAVNFKVVNTTGKTTFMQIIREIMSTYSKKSPVEIRLDKMGKSLAPFAISAAAISLLVWLFVGLGFEFSYSIALAVLIIACPPVFGLSIPTVIMVASGKSISNGILVRNASVFRRMHKIEYFIFSKNGTLTIGNPKLIDIIAYGKHKKKDLLKAAAAVEVNSDHPTAKEIVRQTRIENIKIGSSNGFKQLEGLGSYAKVRGHKITLGNTAMMQKLGIIIKKSEKEIIEHEKRGKSVICIAVGKKLGGLMIFADRLKPHCVEVISELKKENKKIIMVTGDDKRNAESIASYLGIDTVYSGLSLGDKAKLIRKLKLANKKVAFVGSGSSDSLSLYLADLGIAIGSKVMIPDSGQIVLMKDDLHDIIKIMKLSQKTLRKIKQNTAWSYLYNIIGIPLAAGIIYPFSGVLINPVLAAAIMAVCPLVVIMNSLSLKWFKLK